MRGSRNTGRLVRGGWSSAGEQRQPDSEADRADSETAEDVGEEWIAIMPERPERVERREKNQSAYVGCGGEEEERNRPPGDEVGRDSDAVERPRSERQPAGAVDQ